MLVKIGNSALGVLFLKDRRNIVRKQLLRIIFYERILTKRRIKFIHSGKKHLNEIPLDDI